MRRVPANFRPSWTLRRGIEQLRHAYKVAELTEQAFFSPNHFRFARVEQPIKRGAFDGQLTPSTLVACSVRR